MPKMPKKKKPATTAPHHHQARDLQPGTAFTTSLIVLDKVKLAIHEMDGQLSHDLAIQALEAVIAFATRERDSRLRLTRPGGRNQEETIASTPAIEPDLAEEYARVTARMSPVVNFKSVAGTSTMFQLAGMSLVARAIYALEATIRGSGAR